MSIFANQPFNWQSMTGLITGSASNIDFSNLTVQTLNYIQSLNFQGSPITTSQILEGTNLYFTNARSRLAISASNTTGASGITFTYNNITGVISAVILNPQVTINGHTLQLSGTLTLTAADIGLGNVANALQLIAANNLSDLTSVSLAQTNIGAGNAVWNANKLQGINISNTMPTSGQILVYNGTNWIPGSDDTGHDAEFIWTRIIHDSVPSDQQVLIWSASNSYWNYQRLTGSQIYDNGQTNAGKPQFNLVTIGGSSGLNSNLTLNLASDSDSLWVGNSQGKIQILGSANSGANFLPSYWNWTDSSNLTNTQFNTFIITDTGTNPCCIFNSSTSGPGAIVTRPIFAWSNYTTTVMNLAANGDLTLNNQLIINGTSRTEPIINLTGQGGIGGNIVNIKIAGSYGNDYLEIISGSGVSGNSSQFLIKSVTTNGANGGMIFNNISDDSATSLPAVTFNCANGSSTALTTANLFVIQNSTSNMVSVDPNGNIIGNSTTGAFIPNSLTTTQRNALSPINGMMIYNSTLGIHEIYGNSGWHPNTRPYVLIKGSSNSQQSVSASSNTQIALTTSVTNTNSNFYTTGSSNIVVNISGTYRIEGGIAWQSSVGSATNCVLYMQDNSGNRYVEISNDGNSTSSVLEQKFCQMIIISAPATLQLYCFQNSLGSLNIGPSSSPNAQLQSYFGAELIYY